MRPFVDKSRVYVSSPVTQFPLSWIRNSRLFRHTERRGLWMIYLLEPVQWITETQTNEQMFYLIVISSLTFLIYSIFLIYSTITVSDQCHWPYLCDKERGFWGMSYTRYEGKRSRYTPGDLNEWEKVSWHNE